MRLLQYLCSIWDVRVGRADIPGRFVDLGPLGIVPMFVVGLAGFFFILFPLTDPAFFSNPVWDALQP